MIKREFNFEWKLGNSNIKECFTFYSQREVQNKLDSLYPNDPKIMEHGNNEENLTRNIEISDFVSEIHTVIEMRNLLNVSCRNLNNKDEVMNKIFQFDIQMEKLIDVVKIEASILANTAVQLGNVELERELIMLIDVIELAITRNDFSGYLESENIIGSIQNRIQQVTYSEGRSSAIFSKIVEMMNQLVTHNIANNKSPMQIKKSIKYYLKRLPIFLGEKYGLRMGIISNVMKMLDKNNSWATQVRMALFLSDSETDSISYELCNMLNEKQKNTPNLDDAVINTAKFEVVCKDFASFIKSSEQVYLEEFIEGKKVKICVGRSDYRKKKCFGIMESKNEKYFALSGSKDLIPCENNGCAMSNIVQKKYDQPSKVLGDYIGKHVLTGYEWAKLSPRIKRYIEFDSNSINTSSLPIGESTLCTDLNIVGLNHEDIGSNFGCCERKMQAKANNFTSDKKFFARWEPCNRCKPALKKEKGTLEVYALYSCYNDWIDNGKPDIGMYNCTSKLYSR